MAHGLLLIGATGQIGRNIVQQTHGRLLLALAREPKRVGATPDVRPVKFDATESQVEVGEGWPTDAISTLPIWRLAGVFENLAVGGLNRLVCFSTTSIYGKSDTHNAHERAVVQRVQTAEGRVRALAEDHGVGLTILRPTLIYGEGTDRTISAAARFVRRFGFYPVYGAAEGLRQPVHAADLADAAVSALDSPATVGHDYALGGGETLPYREMIARIFSTLEIANRTVRVPWLPPLLDIAGTVLPGSELTGDVARRMNADLDYDDGSAAADFGYAPRRFLSGGKDDLFRNAT